MSPAKCMSPARRMRRQALLGELRKESEALSGKRYSIHDNSLIAELARAAAYSRKKKVNWRGISFPLANGWLLTVLDPDTGRPLVSTPGGALL